MIGAVVLIAALVATGVLVEWAVRRADARAIERAQSTRRVLDELGRHR